MNNKSLWHVTLILLSCFSVRYADSESINKNEGTTTAVPVFSNKSTTIHETTTSVSSSVTPVTEKYTTSSGISSFSTRKDEYSSTNGGQSTTTAMPISATSTIVERQFDTLSFMGGCLFTVTIITVGAFIWKMYEARIERSYLTI